MTPEKALEMLDQAISTINANRQTHAALSNAIIVLHDELKNNKLKKDGKGSIG